MKSSAAKWTVTWIAAGTVVGIAFLFPTSARGGVIAILAALGISAIYQIRPRNNLHQLFFFGLAVYSTGFHWLPKVIQTFGHYSYLSAFTIALCIFAFSSLQFVLMETFHRGLRNSVLQKCCLSLPCSWLSAEFLFPQLIPWSLAHPLLPFTPLVQVADIFGAQFLTFLLLWWSSLTCDIAIRLAKREPTQPPCYKNFTVAVVSFVAVLSYGFYRTQQLNQQVTKAPKISVALTQGNLDPIRDYDESKTKEVLSRYQTLSKSALNTGAIDMLVWPESSVWISYTVNQPPIERGSNLDPFPDFRGTLVFGGQTLVSQANAKIPKFYNTAFALESSGTMKSYHKQILFPFSEQVPLANYFPTLKQILNKSYEYLAAEKQSPLQVNLPNKSGAQALSIGTAICYEDIWPHIFLQNSAEASTEQSSVRRPISLLLAVTNDSWFLDTLAAEQHHMLASWRAIELHRFFLRDSNSGVTAFIDPLGVTVKRLPHLKKGVLIKRDVAILENTTIFQIVGRIPLIALSAFVLLATLANAKRKKSK